MRLIDADKVTDIFKNIAEHLVENENHGQAVALFYAADVINVRPTIDAVEVVRCKDCKYYRGGGKHFTDINFCQRLPYYAEKGGLNTADDDFCSYGERKEE